jgi:hypothetical protein
MMALPLVPGIHNALPAAALPVSIPSIHSNLVCVCEKRDAAALYNVRGQAVVKHTSPCLQCTGLIVSNPDRYDANFIDNICQILRKLAPNSRSSPRLRQLPQIMRLNFTTKTYQHYFWHTILLLRSPTKRRNL